MPAINLIVSALVREEDRLLLIEQQGPWDPTPSWMLPGGRVEPGEGLVEALGRELREETGLRLTGTPRVAFVVDRSYEGESYTAVTFDCAAEGTLAPADPDEFVRAAAWVPAPDALERLACVAWYDCAPITRFLSGEAAAGAVYVGGE